MFGDGVANCQFVDVERFGGNADDRMYVGFRILGHQFHQMTDNGLHRLLTAFDALANHAPLKGSADIEREAVFQCFIAEKDILPHHLGGHEILWPAHVACDPLLFTVAGRRGTS